MSSEEEALPNDIRFSIRLELPQNEVVVGNRSKERKAPIIIFNWSKCPFIRSECVQFSKAYINLYINKWEMQDWPPIPGPDELSRVYRFVRTLHELLIDPRAGTGTETAAAEKFFRTSLESNTTVIATDQNSSRRCNLHTCMLREAARLTLAHPHNIEAGRPKKRNDINNLS